MIDCQHCPLKSSPLFLPHTAAQAKAIHDFKRAERLLDAGETLIDEGQQDGPLFTLLHGWAFRFKTLSDGRRQILNFLLAGDLIGVQQRMADVSAHGVVALTPLRVCVFERDALWALHRQDPALGFAVTWLTASEESMVDEHLLSVGRRSAEERLAALLVQLYRRAAALVPRTTLRPDDGIPFPLTQQHLADALGLSLAHTNKSLRRLEKRGLHRIEDGRLLLRDPAALARLGDLYKGGSVSRRPRV